ncbi:MAG: TetR/AcrR family transcriptional regulator [Clostridiales bacterium]|nr:TetR/AcrR family transcriptional regulator [Clostridiales bacterium]
MDETKQKIIDATMELMKEKGYVATTTKDIASQAKVNECTIFRKFQSKKDIILCGMEQEKWRANVSEAVFSEVTWDLKTDLEMFMRSYLERVTPDFVKLSIGLRAPQIKEITLPYIMKIPEAFKLSMIQYFEQMNVKGKIAKMDYESLAMTIFSSTFGYLFLKASFDEKLSSIEQEAYIINSVELFLNGILEKK